MGTENTLYMLRSVNDDIGDSFIIKTADEKIIVVDGGWAKETENFLRCLRAVTGTEKPRIDAWFLTHAHDDHVEVFLDVMERLPNALRFARVYLCFPPEGTYKDVDDWAYNILRRYYALRPGFADRETVLRDGDVFDIGCARITVLYTYNPAFVLCNESSLIFRMDIGGKSMLFTGDCEPNACAKVLSDPERAKLLDCDICKMSHHGQNGATKEFYQAVSPEICLWPTPAWVWDNRSGNLRTEETKKWVKELGVRKNYISMNGNVKLVFGGAIEQGEVL